LEIIDSPYRSLIEPISDFVSEFEVQHPGVFTTVIIPAFVTRNWWESILHNQTTLFLKRALLAKKKSSCRDGKVLSLGDWGLGIGKLVFLFSLCTLRYASFPKHKFGC
jgi:hypothetical protein